MYLDIKLEAISKFVALLEEINEDKDEQIESLIDGLEFKMTYTTIVKDSTFRLECDKYSLESLKKIRLALSKMRVRNFVKRLDSVISVMEDPDKTELTSLESMPIVVKEFMRKCPHKWIFRLEDFYGTQIMIPYFIHNISYEPEHFDRDGYFEEAYVTFEIQNNNYDGFKKNLIIFKGSDINDRTLLEAFRDKNIFVENEELYAEYEKSNQKYIKRLKEQGKQYKVTTYIDADSTRYSWSKVRKLNPKEDIIPFYHVVNDTKTLPRMEPKTTCSFWAEERDNWGERRSKTYDLPILPYIKGYNLDAYCECYCHVDDIEDYEYDHSLREKLILPQSHKALLDILVNNSQILKGDIINNKGNGTVVILEGPPGCGKTLTTEVYSELIEKPLYKVSSGQLGVDAKDMDKNLYEVLNRASRLNCILLIDECETFVKKRGDDLIQNSIITTFLRKLEYFEGILFLTSNRIKDVDEAILSRCIAAIKYEQPTKENAKKIWRVLVNQFELSDQVPDSMIDNLVEIFPNAVGRDIKELLKLTARYCYGNNKPIDIQSFLDCAQFRYIDANEEYVEKWALKNGLHNVIQRTINKK